jgi:hypothetical protein
MLVVLAKQILVAEVVQLLLVLMQVLEAEVVAV